MSVKPYYSTFHHFFNFKKKLILNYFIFQTSSTKLKLSQNDVPKVPEFLLLVVTQNGTIADVKFNITTDPVVDGTLLFLKLSKNYF